MTTKCIIFDWLLIIEIAEEKSFKFRKLDLFLTLISGLFDRFFDKILNCSFLVDPLKKLANNNNTYFLTSWLGKI